MSFQYEGKMFPIYEKQGTSLVDQIGKDHIFMVACDYFFFNACKEIVGLENAREIYFRVWYNLAAINIANAMQELGIKEVKDFKTFKEIVKFGYAKAPCYHEIVKDSDTRLIADITWCPYLEFGKLFFQDPTDKEASEWIKAAAEALSVCNKAVVETAGFKNVSHKVESCMCLGEKTCRKVFESNK